MDFSIRYVSLADVEVLAQIDSLSYPVEETASKDSIAQRIAAFPEYFWIVVEDEGILSFANGMAASKGNLHVKVQYIANTET